MMTLDEMQRQLETRYPVAFGWENWYGNMVLVSRVPMYMAIYKPKWRNDAFALIVNDKELGGHFPAIYENNNLTPADVIRLVGEHIATPDPKPKKKKNEGQMSLFDMWEQS